MPRGSIDEATKERRKNDNLRIENEELRKRIAVLENQNLCLRKRAEYEQHEHETGKKSTLINPSRMNEISREIKMMKREYLFAFSEILTHLTVDLLNEFIDVMNKNKCDLKMISLSVLLYSVMMRERFGKMASAISNKVMEEKRTDPAEKFLFMSLIDKAKIIVHADNGSHESFVFSITDMKKKEKKPDE